MPRLSLLLPCRNAAPWVDAAARSLERQTFRDFEVIVVDDGSTDATAERLGAWADRDRRVRLLHRSPAGVVAALRLAARHAEGEFIGRMDADDIAHRRRLQAQIDLLESNADLVACGTHVRLFPRSRLKDGARAYEAWLNGLARPEQLARDIFVECPIAHPTLVIRRAPFEEAGGYRDCGWPEDYDLLLRLWSAGQRMANVPERLLCWRERADRTSRTHARYSHDAFRRCKVAFLLETIAFDRPLLIAGAGPTGKAFAREAVRNGARLAAFVDLDPRRIGQTIHGVPVVRPDRIRDFPRAFGVAAVAKPHARAAARQSFADAGWREMVDYCAVA